MFELLTIIFVWLLEAATWFKILITVIAGLSLLYKISEKAALDAIDDKGGTNND